MENNTIEFNQVDGKIRLEVEGDVVYVSAESDYDGTYLYGSISRRRLLRAGTIKDSTVMLKADSSYVDDVKQKMLDFIFINYEKGNSELYGFILLGVERKSLIEVPLEDYLEFREFLSSAKI